MTSILIITSIENLQSRINYVVKSFKGISGIYVSLNKTQKSAENALNKAGINTKNLFFIDCVTSQETKRDDVLHIAPNELNLLSSAIHDFIKDIKGKEFLIIDSLATLLIYNEENKVAKFVKKITEFASQHDTEVIAFSPKTKGEELLNKIFNFFDKVEEK
jgi:archaellum biogenesis ATPase FlaH|tara:strand:+ start:1040 stop:1522 length:483 start_codon:yes stop_codon:yes gene_type:complete